MGLESVKEEIIRNAKEQSSAMIADARRQANQLAKEAEKKIEETKQRIEEETKRTADMTKRQFLAAAELENKKMLLDAKKQVIEKAFEEAKAKIEKMDDKKRETLLKKLLEKSSKEIEVGKVYCSKKDLKLLKGIKAEPAEIIGGLIAENKEGTTRVDYSFESLLESVREKELQKISKILFG